MLKFAYLQTHIVKVRAPTNLNQKDFRVYVITNRLELFAVDARVVFARAA